MTRRERAHAAIYAALIAVFAASAGLFVSQFAGTARF